MSGVSRALELEHRDLTFEDPDVGHRLGDPRAVHQAHVDGHRDGGERGDERHDDQELDEGESGSGRPPGGAVHAIAMTSSPSLATGRLAS
jgi:hypothetical protein